MPLHPIPPNMALVTCRGQGGTGDMWANVFAIDATNYQTSAANTASSIEPKFNTFYTTLVSNGIYPYHWTWDNMNVRQPIGGLEQSADFSEVLTVTDATKQPLPPQLAVCVSWKTLLAGKSFRGRTYVGPLSKDNADANGKLTSVDLTVIQNAATALIAGLSGMTPATHLTIWSRKLGTFQNVTNAHVGVYIDTIRRRRSTLRG